MPTPIKNGTSLSRYRSVWEMRADGWINLVDDLSRLAILPPDDPERARRLAHVHRIVESLTPIESYWAFPGGRVFGELCHWIEREELARAHQAARRIHRVLAARTYRHDANTLDSDHELPSQIETDSERQAQLARPYFEVLIVDEMSASEEDALRRRAAQAQRRRRLHLRRGGRAHVRGRVDRDAGQLQPAGGGDPPRLPIPRSTTTTCCAASWTAWTARSRTCPSSSAARCWAARSRRSGPNWTCTWSPTSTSRPSRRRSAKSSSASSSARKTTSSCTARS